MNGERAYQVMSSRGVDTLVASSTENVFYISDYWSLGKALGCGVEAYALLPIKGEPAIIAPLREADLIVDSGTWIGDLHFYGKSEVELGQSEEESEQTDILLGLYKSAKPGDDGMSSLLKTLEEKELTKGVVAVDASGLTPSLYEYMRQKLPDCTIIDGSDILREIRLVKTESEVERIRRATEITEKSMEDALEIARTEIMEVDLAGMFTYSVAYDGGFVTQNLIGFSDRSAFPHPVPSLVKAKQRDLIRMTLGCTWDHYHSNISRTAIIGSPLAKVKKRWEAVRRAQDAALDTVKPGVKLSSVFTAAEKELETAGLKGCSPSMGHCLGVECNEKPWIQKGVHGELLQGMVINIDIPYLELGWGGVRLEDTVLVTADGYELLTKTERDLYLL